MKIRLLIYLLLLLSFRGYSQSCTLNVTLSQSAPGICAGNGIALTAGISGGTGPFTFIWSTGETTQSINVNKPGNYSVSVSDKTPGCQPVKKTITISVLPTPSAPVAKSVIVCPNGSATLTATAPGGVYQWYDAPVGGNFLASGPTYTTPPVTVSAFYYVETTLGGCTSPRTAVGVFLNTKPTVTGSSVCSGNQAALVVSEGDSYQWYASATSGTILATTQVFTTPPLTATTTYYVVVIASGCSSERTPVTATVTPAPQAPVAADVSVCSGTSANLHADAPAGVFSWYTAPSGGTPLISSPDYTTPPLTATTTYYVQNSINDCESSRTKVTVTVNPLPAAPAPQNTTVCYGTSATLTASANPAGTYQWYDAVAGGQLLATGNTYSTPVLTNSTTYYVLSSNGSCTSARIPVNVTVSPVVPAPSVSGSLVCSGSAATLTATGPGGIYHWYSAATGGTVLATGASYTTLPLNGNTTYYVETTLSGCTSARSAVTVTVLPPQAAPSASDVTVCSGSAASLSATGSAGTYAWYDSATGGNLLATTQVYVTPALASSITYYVEAITNDCVSSRTPVKVTILPAPTPPTVSGTSVCPGTSATLTASSATGTIEWYDLATGGTLLKSGNTYNTPVLTANTTYYVQSTNGTCGSIRTPVIVTVTPLIDPQFQYASGTFCITGANTTPVIKNPSGGTFSASPAGLVFVSTTTGQINISASAPGKYVISFIGNDACPHTTTASISIVTTTNAQFAYAGPYCQDGANPKPSYTTGGSGGVFSASATGLVFVSPSTGEINLAASKAGTYIVTNTIPANGTCPSSSATFTVTINQQAIVSAGPNQAVQTGATVQLAGSISGSVTTGKWSGGTGTFSNPSLLNAVYTPGAGETTATLTLTSADPPGICGPESDQVTITFGSAPPAPTALGVKTCSGSSATLSATAPGGIYEWYDAATAGNLLSTGPNFTTLPLTANTTYYVQTTIGGIKSARTPVLVKVNSVPPAPVAAGTAICSGNGTTLTASGSTGTYEWYDAATGGNLLSTTATYTTLTLTATTTYYVQSSMNGCSSIRTPVKVVVTPSPNITSAATANICNGNALNYTITADQPGVTYLWSRALVAGVSNAGVTNQTSATITEALVNTTSAAVNVTYVIIPMIGTCSGPSFKYVVTVYPAPVVTSDLDATVCNGTPVNYTISFNNPATVFSWNRAAVAGISNAAVSNQNAGIIKEVLYNTTNAPVKVTYTLNYKTSTCAGPPFSFVITVNPYTLITSDAIGTACSGEPQNYVIKSNQPSTTYTWSRDAVDGISNAAVSDQTSSTIDEALVNTGGYPIKVVYKISPITNGCTSEAFKYAVTVNPPITTPIANTNSPVCAGSTVNLRTIAVQDASYLWTGPNGYKSTLQNPDITNVSVAATGTYSLVVIINGCSSPAATADVVINGPPVTIAGPNQKVCTTVSSVQLAGKVSGGTTTGIWTTAGTGTFSPSENVLDAQYLPSDADKAAGSVVLTLTSTSKDDCGISTSLVTITFSPTQTVDAGPDQDVCIQENSVKLDGKTLVPGGGTWTTSGTGTFSPSANQLDASYVPSTADIQSGAVTLTLTSVAAAACDIATDDLIVKFTPPPTVNAGGNRSVVHGQTITLDPTVSDSNVQYLWSPNIDISDITAKNPVITGDIDRGYMLQVTDSRGCVSKDEVFIRVSPEIKIVNTFTPNGDGVNDLWDIQGLDAYKNATVDIFTRYGTKIYHSLGYDKAWDGTFNGKALPVGVYYYVIDTKVNGELLSGYVTIIR